MSDTLSGKSCLLTGAAGGVGRAVAGVLAAEGVKLFLTSRGKGELSRLAKDIKTAVPSAAHVHFYNCDLLETGCADLLHERATETIGTPDIIVNAAGIGKFGKISEIAPEDLVELLKVNVVAPFAIVRKFVPAMSERGNGSIVNISSIAGVYGYPYCTAYSASKAALIGFSRSLREELMPKGVRVFTVCPSSVDTPFMNNVPKHIPREKMLRPEDIAHVVLRLVSQPERVVEEEVVVRPMAFRPYI